MTLDDLRSRYERAVMALRARSAAMREAGVCAEEIARSMHAERRRLAARFKELTPEPLRSRIYERTRAVHGDPLGPTIESLRSRGKSWEDIIESAGRPGRFPAAFPPCGDDDGE
jgi:hypothetical protein